MPATLSARGSLFMYVHTHAELQYYFQLGESRRAANHSSIHSPHDLPPAGKVAEIHPIALPAARQHLSR